MTLRGRVTERRIVRRWTACAVAACAVAACTEPSDVGPDACPAPALETPWLAPFVTDVVGELAASPRATVAERAAARSYLAEQLAAMGWSPEEHVYATGANVFATIPATVPATAPDALDAPAPLELLVGAHFDTVPGSPGANDNATGVAAVLAVARYLADAPCRAAPVTVVFFDEEELGLLGSRAFAATRAPSTVAAVHTLDQVGWDADGDRVFELELPTPALEARYRSAAELVGARISVTDTTATDHTAFRERGFAAVGLTEEFRGGDTSPHYHLPTDAPATVDIPYLTLAIQLLLGTLSS